MAERILETAGAVAPELVGQLLDRLAAGGDGLLPGVIDVVLVDEEGDWGPADTPWDPWPPMSGISSPSMIVESPILDLGVHECLAVR